MVGDPVWFDLAKCHRLLLHDNESQIYAAKRYEHVTILHGWRYAIARKKLLLIFYSYKILGIITEPTLLFIIIFIFHNSFFQHFCFLLAGVADGVGGWRSYGIDPGEFSSFLMRTCERLVECATFNPKRPVSLLAYSYCELLEQKKPILGKVYHWLLFCLFFVPKKKNMSEKPLTTPIVMISGDCDLRRSFSTLNCQRACHTNMDIILLWAPTALRKWQQRAVFVGNPMAYGITIYFSFVQNSHFSIHQIKSNERFYYIFFRICAWRASSSCDRLTSTCAQSKRASYGGDMINVGKNSIANRSVTFQLVHLEWTECFPYQNR